MPIQFFLRNAPQILICFCAKDQIRGKIVSDGVHWPRRVLKESRDGLRALIPPQFGRAVSNCLLGMRLSNNSCK